MPKASILMKEDDQGMVNWDRKYSKIDLTRIGFNRFFNNQEIGLQDPQLQKLVHQSHFIADVLSNL